MAINLTRPQPNIVMPDGAWVGRTANGPKVEFDDTNDYLEITGCNVGIGTTGPWTNFHVVGSSNPRIALETTSATSRRSQITFRSATTPGSNATPQEQFNIGVDLAQNGSRDLWIYDSVAAVNRLTIDSSGNVGIGTTGPAYKLDVVGSTQDVAYLHSNFQTALRVDAYTDANTGPVINWMKARGTETSKSIVQSGDQLGLFTYYGYDGANLKVGAAFKAEVDGTPGTNDMPGRLTFWTTPDGSATAVERMRIDNGGNVGIGTTGPSNLIHIVSNPATTNTIIDVARLDRTTSGTAADGIGCGLVLHAEDASGNIEEAANLDAVFTTAAHATQVGELRLGVMGTDIIAIDSKKNVVLAPAAIATDATDGFTYIPTCAGAPTGVPTAKTGTVALVFDTSNNKLYVYDGGWLNVTLAA